MRLDRLPGGGVRLAEDEEVYLDLSEAQYEDIFYSLPQDSPQLYMLLNGTILTEADDCAILTFVIEANGGVDPSMVILQELVKRLPPLKEIEAGGPVVNSARMDEGEPIGTSIETSSRPVEEMKEATRVPAVRPKSDPMIPVVKPKSDPVIPAARPKSDPVIQTVKPESEAPKVAASRPGSVPPMAKPGRPGSQPPQVVMPTKNEGEDEPFEILVNPSEAVADPFAHLMTDDDEKKPKTVALELNAEGTTISEASKAPAVKPPEKKPATQIFAKRSAPAVEITIQPDGRRIKIAVASKMLDMGLVRYEDMYFAMPGDNASLFRLINDTVLARPEERDAFKDMLGLLGGIDQGMTALQNAVLKVEPPPKKAKSTTPGVKTASTPAKPGSVPPRTTSFGPASSAPVAAPPPRTQTFAQPPAAAKPSMPVAPTGTGAAKPMAPAALIAKPPAVNPAVNKPSTLLPGAASAKPGIAPAAANKPATLLPTAAAQKPQTLVPPGIAKPAVPAKPQTLVPPGAKPGVAPPNKPATMVPPGAKPPPGPVKGLIKPGAPIPFSVDEVNVDDVELVDDVEEIPTAPVAKGANTGKPPTLVPPGAKPPTVAPGGAKPPASVVKPAGAAPPQTKLPPGQSAAKNRLKEVERPQGNAQIKMSKEDMEKTGVKVKAAATGFQIICREYFIQLSKAQYQELHYALPMPVMNMFKLVHNELLKDPTSRGVLMKMIHLAGGPKDFMSALSIQVQAIKPTEDWQ